MSDKIIFVVSKTASNQITFSIGEKSFYLMGNEIDSIFDIVHERSTEDNVWDDVLFELKEAESE